MTKRPCALEPKSLIDAGLVNEGGSYSDAGVLLLLSSGLMNQIGRLGGSSGVMSLRSASKAAEAPVLQDPQAWQPEAKERQLRCRGLGVRPRQRAQ